MCKLVNFFWNSLFHRCSQYDHFFELPLMLHPLAQEQSLIKSGCFCSPSCDLFPGLWWPQNTHHARHARHAQTGVSNIPNLPELLASRSSIIINDQKWWSCHRNVIGIILSPLSTWSHWNETKFRTVPVLPCCQVWAVRSVKMSQKNTRDHPERSQKDHPFAILRWRTLLFWKANLSNFWRKGSPKCRFPILSLCHHIYPWQSHRHGSCHSVLQS